MNRRQYLVVAGTAVAVGTAGCAEDTDTEIDAEEDGDAESDERDDGSTTTPSVDTGVVYDGELSDSRDWTVDVAQGQTVTVTVDDISGGEQVLFKVGDGTAFVHSRTFSDDDGTTDQYQFESDGRHQLRVSPERAEPPVDEEVTVTVTIELGEP